MLTKRNNGSSTKRGPGRIHCDGIKKHTPKAPTGAGFGFVQHTNPAKNARRIAKAASGARQLIKAVKAARRIATAGA